MASIRKALFAAVLSSMIASPVTVLANDPPQATTAPKASHDEHSACCAPHAPAPAQAQQGTADSSAHDEFLRQTWTAG